MKVVVMATGGVGGYFGAQLAKSGHEVIAVARGEHLQAIIDRGITIKSEQGIWSIKPALATDRLDGLGEADLVLFSVKAYDNLAAAQAIKPVIGAHTTVLTLQNGVDNADQIGSVIGKEHLLAAPAVIVSNIVAPGVIEQKAIVPSVTIGEVYTAELTLRVERITNLLSEAGIKVRAVEDGRIPLWNKLCFIAPVAGITSLARATAHQLFEHQHARDLLWAAMEEVRAVASAQGVRITDEVLKRNHQTAVEMHPQAKMSMHLDLEQAKRLEIDALSGVVVRLGAQANVPTPIHQTIYTALKMSDLQAMNQRK